MLRVVEEMEAAREQETVVARVRLLTFGKVAVNDLLTITGGLAYFQ